MQGHFLTAHAAGQVVADDPKIIYRDMRELRAASTVANCPDIGRRRLQTVLDAYIAARIQCDARRVEADTRGVRSAPNRDQDVACLDRQRRSLATDRAIAIPLRYVGRLSYYVAPEVGQHGASLKPHQF